FVCSFYSYLAPCQLRGSTTMELHDMLTKREWEVYALIFQGLTYTEIGHLLFIAENTVSGHAIGIFNKIGVNTRAEAQFYASVHGLFQEIVEFQVMQEQGEEYSTDAKTSQEKGGHYGTHRPKAAAAH